MLEVKTAAIGMWIRVLVVVLVDIVGAFERGFPK